MYFSNLLMSVQTLTPLNYVFIIFAKFTLSFFPTQIDQLQNRNLERKKWCFCVLTSVHKISLNFFSYLYWETNPWLERSWGVLFIGSLVNKCYISICHVIKCHISILNSGNLMILGFGLKLTNWKSIKTQFTQIIVQGLNPHLSIDYKY